MAGAGDETGRLNETGVLAEIIAQSAGDDAFAISKKLIDEYGSIAALLARSNNRDAIIPGIPARVANSLRMMAAALTQGWRDLAMSREVLASSLSLHKYLQMDMSGLRQEHFRVLFLDSENRLIDDRMMWKGTVDRVQAHPREIVKAALALGSTALILVHNHPSGDAGPSKDDMVLTERVITACDALDIAVHDHLIIGPTSTFSIRTRQRTTPWS